MEIMQKQKHMHAIISEIYIYLREKNSDVEYLQSVGGPSEDTLILRHMIKDQCLKVGIIGLQDEILVQVNLQLNCEPVFKMIAEAMLTRINTYSTIPRGVFSIGISRSHTDVIFKYTHSLINKPDEVKYFGYRLFDCLCHLEKNYEKIANICAGILTEEEKKSYLCQIKELVSVLTK